jgi:uncharacterized protein YcbX
MGHTALSLGAGVEPGLARATMENRGHERREVPEVVGWFGRRTAVRIVELWRHPVKSLQGESLDEAVIEDSGLSSDRRWGIVDRETGMVLTARRVPSLLLASARLTDTGVELRLPDGAVLSAPTAHADEVLSKWIGRPVSLVHAESMGAGVGEYFQDATDDASAVVSWTMPPGRFVDALPLLIITTASLRQGRGLHPDGAWETRRFRPNVVVDVEGDGWVEDAWCGRSVHLGTAVVQPAVPCERCTMVTRHQPGLGRDLDVFKALARHHGSTFGVWTAVQTPGVVRVGDEVTLTD